MICLEFETRQHCGSVQHLMIQIHLKVYFLQHGAPRAVQVERLLDFIQKRPTWRFHALLRACALTHQESVIHELGFDPEVYQEEDGSQPSSNSGDKVKLYGQLLRGKFLG